MGFRSAIIPAIRYENAVAAIEFLVAAFGFERQLIVADPADPAMIHHAQLLFQGNMVMLGTARDDAARARFGWRLPKEAGGNTMSVNVLVADPDAHAAQAAAAGAEIIEPPYDNQGFPGRSYIVRDPEGHVWNFTNFDPFALL